MLSKFFIRAFCGLLVNIAFLSVKLSSVHFPSTIVKVPFVFLSRRISHSTPLSVPGVMVKSVPDFVIEIFLLSFSFPEKTSLKLGLTIAKDILSSDHLLIVKVPLLISIVHDHVS